MRNVKRRIASNKTLPCIWVSEVAAAIGKNPYKSPEEVAFKIWQRTHNKEFQEMCEKYSFQSLDQLSLEKMEKSLSDAVDVYKEKKDEILMHRPSVKSAAKFLASGIVSKITSSLSTSSNVNAANTTNAINDTLITKEDIEKIIVGDSRDDNNKDKEDESISKGEKQIASDNSKDEKQIGGNNSKDEKQNDNKLIGAQTISVLPPSECKIDNLAGNIGVTIVDGKIVDGKIVDGGEIDDGKIDDDKVNGSKVVDGSKIDDSKFSGAKVDDGKIDDGKIVDSKFSGDKVNDDKFNINADNSAVDNFVTDNLSVTSTSNNLQSTLPADNSAASNLPSTSCSSNSSSTLVASISSSASTGNNSSSISSSDNLPPASVTNALPPTSITNTLPPISKNKKKIEEILTDKKNLALLEKEIYHRLQTQEGLSSEKFIIDNAEVKFQTNIAERNESSFTINLGRYTLKGKVDGIDRKNRMLYEVKSRQNRLFAAVPDYERIPILIYLEMTQLPKAKHIQVFRDKEVSTVISRDSNWFTFVLIPMLNEFFELLESVCSDRRLQLKLMKKYLVRGENVDD